MLWRSLRSGYPLYLLFFKEKNKKIPLLSLTQKTNSIKKNSYKFITNNS
ncbi:hypothetical protein GIY83_24350 [Flavobacterium sp. SLB02]|nr:hypothetical protein GIY83_24350 [Flavobacterium sp. SLB02]